MNVMEKGTLKYEVIDCGPSRKLGDFRGKKGTRNGA